MAIIVFELDELARLGIAKEEIKEVTDKLGMSLESMDDKTATIDITPNRPDMLDIVGFARAVAFLNNKKTPKEKFYSIKNNPIMQVKVTPKVKKIRPFISAAVFKNVDLGGNRLKNLINFTEKFCETYGRKRKKIAIGLYDFDAIEGPLVYDAAKDGEIAPLGSKTKIKFKDVIDSHEKGIEYSGMLEGSSLYPYLKDSKNVLSIIPIVNSEQCKVSPTTKNILVELTGTSQNAVDEGLGLVACSFIDANADAYPCEIIYGNKTRITPQLEYGTIKIKKAKIEKMLGVYLEDNRPIVLANRLGYAAAKYGSSTLVYVPPYRIDVLNEQDVIEDMAIAYGYNKIEPQPVIGSSKGMQDRSKQNSNSVSTLMIGMGFTEAMNPYLTNEHLNFEEMERSPRPESTISITYTKTESITMLRTDLLPWLLQNLSISSNERMPQKLFEIGSVFNLKDGKPEENTNLAMVSEHSRSNYSEMNSVIHETMKLVGINDYTLKDLKDGAFIDGRAAKVMIGNEAVAFFGEISPKVLQNFKLEEPVVAAEINLHRLMGRARGQH